MNPYVAWRQILEKSAPETVQLAFQDRMHELIVSGMTCGPAEVWFWADLLVASLTSHTRAEELVA